MKFKDLIYERIDYSEISKKYQDLLERLEKEENADKFIEIFKQIEDINVHVETMATLAEVRHSINTKDEFYEKENDFWDETSPLLQTFSSRLAKICLAFESREGLYKYIPETYFKLAECEIKSFDERIIGLLQQENKLTSEYGKLKAGAVIEFEGKIYNLSSINPLTYSEKRETRKKAYDAKMNFYKENQEKFDDIYDQLVKVRDRMAKELGYDSFVELGYYRLSRLDYNEEMVANYRRQILEDIVPIVNELTERQAKRLELDELKYYDVAYKYKSGNAKPKGEAEDLVKAAVNMYHQMSKETAEFIDVMNDNDLWDLLSRDGKEMGGYTTSIDEYKIPFIFANFNGTSGDVDVLTHEAGHAFQYYMSKDVPVVKWPTMESCEIHSMSMEFFAYPWAKDFFKEDTEKYLFTHFTGTLEFLPYGVLVDHFQHEVYKNPQMSKAERKACWRRLEKMYMPYNNYDGCEILEEGCWWYQQGHIFESPFYYIDYTLAQVCALQFWARTYKNDSTAFEDYLKICSVGGTRSFIEIVKLANLMVPFEDGCVKDVVNQAKDYLATIDDNGL